MPKAWLRDVVRQRGFHPAPEFSVDTELAEEARRRVGKQRDTTIERVLSEPASDPDLVRAARDHLAGRPDPVGAAAIAAVVVSGEQSVHAWIADHGLVFATEATVEFMRLLSGKEWLSQQRTYGNERLASRGGYFHITIGSVDVKMLMAVRYALANASDAERDAAEAVLGKLGDIDEPNAKLVRSFVLPGRPDWFQEACRTPHTGTRWWILHCSASTFEEFESAPSSVAGNSTVLHTALYVLGPAIAPLLAAALRRASTSARTPASRC